VHSAGSLVLLRLSVFAGNQIETIPECVSQLSSVTQIDLGGKRNAHAAKSMAIYVFRFMLTLSRKANQIPVISNALCTLTHLSALFLWSM
jgi:hypothetical protein